MRYGPLVKKVEAVETSMKDRVKTLRMSEVKAKQELADEIEGQLEDIVQPHARS